MKSGFYNSDVHSVQRTLASLHIISILIILFNLQNEADVDREMRQHSRKFVKQTFAHSMNQQKYCLN